jgi:formylglycine-generating enzyme required for sulfatase activity
MRSLYCVKVPKLFVPFLVIAWCLSAAESRSDEPDKTVPPVAESMLGKKAGEVRDDNGLKMKLVWCPRGEFTMEQADPIWPDEKNRGGRPIGRKITPVKAFVTRGYWLGKYEVTQSEWKQVIETEPWKDKPPTEDGDDFPATFVSWKDAMRFCQKLTDQEREAGRLPDGWEFTLPTEAQWERACRAGTETKFSFGDDDSELYEYAWFAENAMKVREQYAHQVGQKKPNPWGLYDMHGNVMEWCRDWWGKLPGGRDPEVTENGVAGEGARVFRGGGWHNPAGGCRSAFRTGDVGRSQSDILGFRVALSPIQNAKPAEEGAGVTDK